MDELNWFGDVSGLPHSGTETHLILEILRAIRSLLSVLSREIGLPFSQVTILRVLAGSPPQGMGVLDIARKMEINAAAVTRLVKNVEERGLVIRQADKHDGRRSYLRLSAKGRRLFLIIHRRIHEFEDLIGAKLTKEDIETTKRVLVQLRTALEKFH